MIKRLLILSLFIFGLVTQAQAGVGVLFGVSFVFGISQGQSNDFGITIKALSDDEDDTAVVAAGVSYYPFAEVKKFGADLSAGYLFKNGAVTGGWDFLQWKPQLAVGYVDTEDDNPAPAAPAPPPSSEET
ncbi:MAG: hypothetical protein L3J57_12990 [Desulfuromusa sp.]|nr:hypothetical protein [Desulfuromusa sp.]